MNLKFGVKKTIFVRGKNFCMFEFDLRVTLSLFDRYKILNH